MKYGLRFYLVLAGFSLAMPVAWSTPPTNAPSTKAAHPAKEPDGEPSTTIVGDDEGPVGLYLTPWTNESARTGCG